MPRLPLSDAYRSWLIYLQHDLDRWERIALQFSMARIDELSPSEKKEFWAFLEHFRELRKELEALRKKRGI